MTEDGEERRPWWPWVQVLAGVVVLLVIYVLSPGPVALLQDSTVGMESEWMREYVWTKFYAPLVYLADEYSLVGGFYEWFFETLGVE